MTESRENRVTPDEQTVEITLPNKLGYERIAMGSVAAFAKAIGFLPSRVEDLKTAVAEACINAVQHGNKGRANARVVVSMDFSEGVLSVSVFDEGAGIEAEPKDPDIIRIMDNLDPPIGFGTFLMKRLMDQVVYKKHGGHRHEVRMKMKLGD